MSVPSHRYLEGNFGPVHEELTAADLPVTGTIPAELDGRLIRNGPNPISEQDPETYHWFTGDGMVHGVRIRDGKAEWYRNRWVRSPEVARGARRAAPPSPYGPDVPSFAANTNVFGMAGKTYAIVEAGSPPVELTDELETVGPSDFQGTLEHPFSAHPKHDPVTGEWHVVAYFWGWGNQIRYMSISPDGKVQKSVDVATPGGPMVHDTAFTREVRAAVRPAGHVRPRGRDGRRSGCRTTGTTSTARASACCRVTGGADGRRPVVRHRALLLLPPAQRVRPRRRARRARRGALRPDVRQEPPGPERERRRASTAGRSTRPRGRWSRRRSTTAARSSRASTRRCRASATATGTAAAFERRRVGRAVAQARPRRGHDRGARLRQGPHDARAGVRAP